MKVYLKFVFVFLTLVFVNVHFSLAGKSVRLEKNHFENEILENSPESVESFTAIISGSNSVCQNSSTNPVITFTGSGGDTPYTFTYQMNGVTQQVLETKNTDNSIQISVNTLQPDTFTFTLISIKDKSGIEIPQSGSATVIVNPLPDLSINSDAVLTEIDGKSYFKVCSNTLAEVTFTNESTTKNLNSNYTFDWGDGTPSFSIDSLISIVHNYAIGIWKLTYTIKSHEGCKVSKTYDVYVGSNPTVSFGSPGNTDNCSNTLLSFPIYGTEKNPPGTTYTVSFNDGSPSQTFTHPPPAEVTHIFNVTSCGITSYNGTSPYPNSFSASMVASNMCGETAVNVVPIYVSTSPVVNFSISKTPVSTNTPIVLTNTTTGYVNEGANCKIVPKLVWRITPSIGVTLKSGSLGSDYDQDNSNLWIKGTDIINPVFSVPGVYKIKLRVDTKRCGTDYIEKTICVEAPLVPQFTLNSTSGCSPLDVATVNSTDLSKTCTSTIKWSVTYQAGNCGQAPPTWSYANGTNELSSSPSFNFVTPGTYSIKLLMTNSSGSSNVVKTVTVKSPPTVTLNKISDFCGSASVLPVATINTCTPSSDFMSYEWSFPGGSPESSKMSFPGIIKYNSVGKYFVSLKVTNECGFTTVTSNEFSVNSIPVVEITDNQYKNNGDVSNQIVFNGTQGAVFDWTNDNPGIGLSKSGTGTIAEFILKNNGNSVQTANITVTPRQNSTLCIGNSRIISIVVNPTADLNQPKDQVVANGQNTSEIIFTTNRTGGHSTYSWTIDNSTIGLQKNGDGNINSFIAKNNTNEPIVATITVSPVFENGNVSNVGISKLFKITVLPTAQIDQLQDLEVCNGTKTLEIEFTSPTLGGTNTFTWTNDNTSIGLLASGSGNIPGFTVNNKDPFQHSATISVTPVYTFEGASYPGKAKQFLIKVNPGPVITTQPASSSICRGGTVMPLKVEYADGAGTPSYQWYSNKINLNSGGTLIPDAITETYIPATLSQGITYYYCKITLPSGICPSVTSDVAMVTVNDAAIINIQPNPLQSICLGGTVSTSLSIGFTGGSGSPAYQWYINKNKTNQGGIAIPGAINSTYTPKPFIETGNYYYYVEVLMSGNGCGSVISDVGQVSVFKDPVVDIQPLKSQTLCQGIKPIELSVGVSGGLGSFTYQWFVNSVNDNSSGIQIPNANLNSYSPSTELTGTNYYYCEISQPSGLNCKVTSNTATVIVNPLPVITNQPVSNVICQGELPETLYVRYQYGVGEATYQWYSNDKNNTTSGSILQGANNQNYIPLSTIVGTTFYYCVISFSSGGISTLTSNVASISVNQVPFISARKITICNGSEFTIIPDNTEDDIVPAGTTYTWSKPLLNPIGSISGSLEQTIPVSEFKQHLFNLTDSPATAVFTVTPSTATCIGDDFTVEVRIVAAIKINPIVQNITCFAANNGSIQTNISGGMPFKSTNQFDISWTGPNGFTATTKDLSNLTPGVYQISITDSIGCKVTDSFKITEPSEIVITTDSIKDIDCYSSGNGQILILVTGGTPGYLYQWTKNNQLFATTKNLINIGPGNYEVTITDKNGCVSKTASFNIAEPREIIIKLVKQTDITCFGDSTGAISVEVTGGTPTDIHDYFYSWMGPNNFSSDKKDLTNLPAGIYQLTVFDKNSCQQTLVVNIIQSDELIIKTTTSPVTCYDSKNASITLNITGGTKPYRIQWSNLGSGLYQENLSPGEYTINVIDANNCNKSVSVTIKEANFSIQPVIKNVSCFGASDGSINLNISGGINPVSLVWDDDPAAGNQRNHLGAGIYTVTLRDGAPCIIIKSFVISEPQQIVLSAKISHAYDCDIQGSGAIELIVSGGKIPYRFQWTNGSVSKDLTNVPPGKYEVLVTDSSGCTKSAQFEVVRPLPLNVLISSKSELNCDTKTLKMICKGMVTGGYSPYRFVWSYGGITVSDREEIEITQNTVVTLLVTDSLGCTSSCQMNVNLPEVGIQHDVIECSKLNYQFNAFNAQFVAPNYTYDWDFGDGVSSESQNPQHKFPKAGIYKVNLTIKSLTCESSFVVTINTDQILPLTLDREPKFCEGDSSVIHIQGAYSYKWSDGSIGDSIIIKQKGDYSVIGTSLKGCMDTLNFSSSSYDLFKYTVQSDKNEIVPDGSVFNLWSEYIPYTQYSWDFGDGSVGFGDKISHVFKVNKDGYFDVELKVVNPNGCVETDKKRFWITIPELPNTFSPNGDGINDYFLKDWDLKIYNRNGAILYEGRDGWDGKYNGKPVSSDIYFFIVYYQSVAGTKTKTGYVRVIR